MIRLPAHTYVCPRQCPKEPRSPWDKESAFPGSKTRLSQVSRVSQALSHNFLLLLLLQIHSLPLSLLPRSLVNLLETRGTELKKSPGGVKNAVFLSQGPLGTAWDTWDTTGHTAGYKNDKSLRLHLVREGYAV